jgi:hypothetical protein
MGIKDSKIDEYMRGKCKEIEEGLRRKSPMKD